MADRIHGYGKVWDLSHREATELLEEACVVEEKIDGSQFSFQLKDGELLFRSKGAVIDPQSPPDIFKKAVESVKEIHKNKGLSPGWVYRGEALKGLGHNVIKYERSPDNHVVIWDIDQGLNDLLSWNEKRDEAERLGYEVAPLLYQGMVTPDILSDLLSAKSMLGGEIEGVAIKRLRSNTIYGRDGKVLVGKFVSDKFKESHKNAPQWKSKNKADIISFVVSKYSTEARWNKAAQHLEEEGLLEFSPRDISKLIKRVLDDIQEECYDGIKEDLAEYYWRDIKKRIPKGIPEWWKSKMLDKHMGDANQE